MAIRNITVQPSSMAIAVAKPEIEEVRNTRSGTIVSARRFIEGRQYDRLVRLRGIILELMKRGTPRLVCAMCGCPVYLVSSPEKAFFFRHKIEDGSCTARTRKELSEGDIRARKYQGARESDAHRRVKAFIERSLLADARIADVHVEKTWRSSHDPSALRRPDVQARFAGIRLAFEAQLTTTFLDVVVGRRMFYREQDDALLIWILRRFDPEYRRLTEDDILFSNNSNILVVDEETTRISEKRSRFFVRCHYREPYDVGEERRERWCGRLVALDELTFDLKGQRAYWFDFEARDQAIRQALARKSDDRRRMAEERLRNDVFAFWERCGAWDENNDDCCIEWSDLRAWLMRSGIAVPFDHRTDGNFRTALSSILSAKLGRPVGYRFKKLIEVAHMLAEAQKRHLYAFGWALRVYGTEVLMQEQDLSGKWAMRRKMIRDGIASNDPEYAPCRDWSETIRFFFPELSDRIGGTLYAAGSSTKTAG